MRTRTTNNVYAAVGQVSADLREARERLGITRCQLAGLAGCSLSALGSIEAGAVPRESPTLARIQAVLAELEKTSKEE